MAKTKALISFTVTAKLICTFGFAYADCWFSHEAAHILNKSENASHYSQVLTLIITQDFILLQNI